MTRRTGGYRRARVRGTGLVLLLVAVAGAYVAPAAAAGPGDGVVGLGVRSAVTGGELHTCALTSAGGVKCWGANAQGQLGDGTTDTHLIPVDVVGLPPDVKSVDAGSFHTCAVTGSGAVWCWGDGNAVPMAVAGLETGVRAVSAGTSHSCALMLGGAVKCWGTNDRGQLGDGTTTDRPAPVEVAGLASGVRALSAGRSYTCAVTSARGVVCWGANEQGQLGDGTTTDRPTPVGVAGVGDVSMVDTGSGSVFEGSHTCAVVLDGTVACWGYNGFDQLGSGPAGFRPVPAPVVGLPAGVQAVATGARHSCALTAAGAVWCWGDNTFAQLGDGTPFGHRLPVEVPGLAGGQAELTAGTAHTCALDRRGGLACWGLNVFGQIGNGTSALTQAMAISVSGSFHRPECPTLVVARHSTLTLTNGYALGSRATFAATSGFVLTGPANLRCQPDGTWNGSAPGTMNTAVVTITPNTGLVDGQLVTVTLTGWPAFGTVPWCEGVRTAQPSPSDCGARLVFSTPDATGTVVDTYVVDRVMFVPSLGRTVDCAVEPISAIAATDLQDIVGSVVYAPLSFAPP